jgi:type 1 fimbria pilin
MAKLWVALLLLAPGTIGDMPTITLDPAPPVQGQKLTIKYDGAANTTLQIEWTPPGEPSSVTIGKDGTAVITVPAEATTILVTDESGGAQGVGDVIVPSSGAGARAKRGPAPRKGRRAPRS